MKSADAFQEAYNRLNPEQKRAVDTIEGPVFVMAGPGTGKTQILTLRIANILRSEAAGIDPENILALTFTNTAAYNMQERLAQMIGAELAHRIQISTFHSFAETMIKRNVDAFPELFRARLASDIERVKIIEEILEEYPTHYFSVFRRRSSTMMAIASSLDKVKNEGLSADEFRTRIHEHFKESMNDEEVYYKRAYQGFKAGDMKPAEVRKREHTRDKQLELADIYELYQTKLREHSLYDYSDLIVCFIHALRNDSEFRTDIQETFHYILVDEHQDTNDAQNTILHLLIDNPANEGKPNIFVVGDDKQAIFRFAGASQSSFRQLQNLVDDMTVIDLVHNYRSGQHVLDRAHHLITQSAGHADAPVLESFFKDYDGRIEYREFSTHKLELLWLSEDIKHRIDAGESPDDIAILYRNNRDASDIQHVLGTHGISYQDRSKKNLLADPDMLKLFLLFRAIRNLDDDAVLARALYIDFIGCDVRMVEGILRTFKAAKRADTKSIFAIISDSKTLMGLGADTAQSQKLLAFSQFLAESKTRSINDSFPAFFAWCIRESGFLAHMLSRPNAVMALAKVEKLYDEVKKESNAREEFSFDDFIHYIESLKHYALAMQVAPVHRSGVQLMTFHGAKGLEFETVYIVKAMDKRGTPAEIPLPFGMFDEGKTDDERRLFYVALTRAKKNIMISSHRVNEQGKEKSRSPFIDEIPGIDHISPDEFERASQLAFAQFLEPVREPLLSITSQEFIREKFLTNRLSVSALNNYCDEPLLYFFRNLLQLPDATSPFLDFGNLVHETLERYFKQCKDVQEIMGKEVLESSLQSVVAGNIAYRPYAARAWKILEAYFDARAATFSVPLENEFRIASLPFELETGETIQLTGVIDKLTRDASGNIIVWDYKTGKAYSQKDKAGKEAIKRQGVFYKLLLSHAFDGRYNPRTIIFDFVEPVDVPGEYEQMELEVTQDDVEHLKREINQLAEDVLGGTLLKHAPSYSEKTAEYIELLAMIQGEAVQGELF